MLISGGDRDSRSEHGQVPFCDSASHSHSCLQVEKRLRGEKRYFISLPMMVTSDQPPWPSRSTINRRIGALTRIARVERSLVDIIAGRHAAGEELR